MKNFNSLVEKIRDLTIDEQQELQHLLQKFLVEARRDEIQEELQGIKKEREEAEIFRKHHGTEKACREMIEVAFSPSFKRVLKKRVAKNKSLEDKFWGKVELFVHDPFDRSLRTHQLTGALKELWSFSIEYDCRVIFYFLSSTKVVFTDIGTHDEVY